MTIPSFLRFLPGRPAAPGSLTVRYDMIWYDAFSLGNTISFRFISFYSFLIHGIRRMIYRTILLAI